MNAPSRPEPATFAPPDPDPNRTPTLGSPARDTDAPEVAAPDGGMPAAPPGYELLDEVGEGGMGVVYRARDSQLDRDVAIKVLGKQFAATGPAAQRFLDEARITGQLQHPGVPPVHQTGTLADGRPFLVMKLIKGQTLSDLMADGAVDHSRLVATFEQVCQAVGYAHARDVIHRDLKPANVMVGAFGEVQVMDWGLAKVLSSSPARACGPAADDTRLTTEIQTLRAAGDATRAGSVLGTPAYMPPEQAIGAVDKVDQQSDVFGLGAILCAILTGRPAYVGEDHESTRQLAARARLEDAFARLDGCGAEPDLVALCRRCLAAEKCDRPKDGGEVAREVASIRTAADDRARRAEVARAAAEVARAAAEVARAAAAAEAREQRKRRQVQLAVAGLTLIFVLAGSVAFGWWQDRKAREERERLARNGDAVATALGQCEAALRVDDASEARRALDRASQQSLEGGAGHLANRFDRCRADLTLLPYLVEVDTFRWSAIGDRPEPRVVVDRWRTDFVRYGLRPGDVPASEVADRIAESLIRERLIATLDLWLALEPQPAVRDVLRAADPGPNRDAIRDAILARQAARAAALGDSTDALAGRPGLAVAIGHLNALPADRRRSFLLRALDLGPNRFTGLMELGASYPRRQREGAAERVGWYKSAIAARPDSSIAWYNLGIARSDLGELPAARVAYRRSIELDPEAAVGSLNNLAMLMTDAGEYNEAIDLLTTAIRRLPSSSQLQNNLGHTLRVTKDLDGAIAAFRLAARLDPNDPLPWANLGVVLGAKKDFAGAAAAYQEAIRLNPADPDARLGYGSLLYDQEKADQAAEQFREAVRLDPASALAHGDLGNALRVLGDLDAAAKEFRESIRLDSKSDLAHNGLAGVLILQKDYAGAAGSAREAIRLDPNHALAHNNLGLALFKLKDLDGSMDELRRAVELDPACVAAHNNLGNTLSAKKDLPAAIAAYREAIRLDPKYVRAYNGLAIARSESSDLPGAVAGFRTVARLDPADPWAHVNLGIALHLSGAADEALAEFREGIRLDSKNPTAFARLGMALCDRGRYREAVDALRTATRLVPNQPVLARELARAERLLALDERLPAIKARTAHPATPAEAVELAQFAARPPATEFGLSLRLFNEAFTADPKLVAGNRYAAASVAVQVAAGHDPSSPVGADEWFYLQSRARHWLAEELAVVHSLAASPDPARRKAAADILRTWQTDPALGPARNPTALAGMPADERTAWAAFWAEVDVVRAEARRPPELGPPPRMVRK